MFRQFVIIFLLLATSSTAFCQEPIRKWTSRNGNYSVQAEFLELDGNRVRLRKLDGSTIEVELDDLSIEDREYIAGKAKNAKRDHSSLTTANSNLKTEFGKFDLRLVGGSLILADENRLGRELSSGRQLRRRLSELDQTVREAQAQEQSCRNQMRQLTILNGQLNTQLAGVTDPAQNNRLVGAINANTSKLRLLDGQLVQLREQVKLIREQFAVQRDQYLQFVLEMRRLATTIQEKRTELADDSELAKLIQKAEAELGDRPVLQESKSFQRSMKRLDDLEDTVLSATIPLELRGNTLMATVNFSGEHTAQMIVDSGASVICLPYSMAQKFDLQPDEDAPKIFLTVADGRQIEGQMVTIDSVRVGQFEVENVRAVVLGPEATGAEPLLGMSFLQNFKFELNAAKGTLTMVKLADEN